jgi:ribonuclease J
MPSTVDIVSLGGCGGFGMNATLFAAGDRAVLIDFGLGFPRDVLPGAARVVPDPGPLLERWPRLSGIVLTHAHDDHVGALGHLPDGWAEAPIHGRPLTLAVAEERWRGVRRDRPDLREVHPGQAIRLGPFTVSLLHVTHSVPESSALRIDGPAGTILHSGDFKLDPSPRHGPRTDLEAIDRAGRDGVRLLMLDSTGAVVDGACRPESSAAEVLESLVSEAPGQVVVATFSTHLERIDALCEIGARTGRRVALVGRRLQAMAHHGIDRGYLDPAPGVLVGPAGLESVPPAARLVVASGCQGEPESALGRLSTGSHPSLEIREGDLVAISARTIPGNEVAVSRLVDRFLRLGARVVTPDERPGLHASGHGPREDLAEMIDRARPETLVPIHGDRRHLVRAEELARNRPAPPRQVEIVERGEWLHLDEHGLRRGDTIELPPRLIDDAGRTISFQTMRSRRRAAMAGAAVLSVRRRADGSSDIRLESAGLAVDPAAIAPEIEAEVRKLLPRPGAHADREELRDKISRRVARRLAGGRSAPKPVVRVLLDDDTGGSW